MKKLAVIMSLYKNDKLDFLKLSVESILKQTFSEFDFYIQFDGEIRKECELYLKNLNDNRVIIFERDENKGLAVSLNDLLKQILPKKYTYIARMDADDISTTNRFQKQITFLENNTDIDSLGSFAIEIKEDGSEFYKKQMPKSHIECLQLFQKRDCYIHPTVMFRKTYFEKAGLYPEDTYFGEDTMMWANGFAKQCTFSNLPEYLLYFRLDNNFFERRRGWKHAKSIFLLRRRVNKLLNFGIKADIFALLYATAKLMPKFVLNLIYKTAR